MQMSNVSSRYGAPMGRPSSTEAPTSKLELFQLHPVDGDYDNGGAYWGFGPGSLPVWCCRCDEHEFEVFVRAASRTAAWEKVTAEHTEHTLVLKSPVDGLEAWIIEGFDHYITAMLWLVRPMGSCEEEDDDESWSDKGNGVGDLVPSFRETLLADYRVFVQSCVDASLGVDVTSFDCRQFGHDAWLTREGHGCGFGDGDWPEHGDALGRLARAWGESYLCTFWNDELDGIDGD
jgi:hypothetical protein